MNDDNVKFQDQPNAALMLILSIIIALAAPKLFAQTGDEVDQRYQFDQFERVKHFRAWSIDGWTPIDQRSLLVSTSPSTSYLLILKRRVPGLRFFEPISISTTGSHVYARFDSVQTVSRFGVNIPSRIDRIYKIKGKENRRLVYEQING